MYKITVKRKDQVKNLLIVLFKGSLSNKYIFLNKMNKFILKRLFFKESRHLSYNYIILASMRFKGGPRVYV